MKKEGNGGLGFRRAEREGEKAEREGGEEEESEVVG